MYGLLGLFASMSIVRRISSLVFALIVIVSSVAYLSLRKQHKRDRDKLEQQVEEQYEKDENGLFPWEVDTDDSPDRVAADAKRFQYNDRPKRGRW